MKPLRILLLFSLSIFMVACTLEDDLDPISGDDRDKFTDTWMFFENEVSRGASYSVTISNDPGNSSQVLLKNFGNMGHAYSAYGIVTTSRIEVPSQEIYSGITIEGSGRLVSSDEMEWTYSITGGGEYEEFTATASR